MATGAVVLCVVRKDCEALFLAKEDFPILPMKMILLGLNYI